MKSEYLLFDLAVFLGPFVLGFFGPTYFRGRSARAWLSVLLAAIPFLVWDALVAGQHWNFSPDYTLGVSFLGLPLEEWLFFAVVPYALVFSWEMFFNGSTSPRRPGLAFVPVLAMAALIPGIYFLTQGKGYTGLTLTAFALTAVFDRLAGTRVLERRAYLGFMGVVVLTTVVFDGYLTARPVVTYDDSFNLGLRLGTIPIEDFLYGLTSGTLALSIYSWFGQENAIDRAIEKRFGGYRHEVVTPDLDQPYALEPGEQRKVAVVGTGIAGIRAASELAKRGFSVTMFEKEHYMGGKIGAWQEVIDGLSMPVEHGFHAFFHHYYNFNDFLDELSIRDSFEEIEDYAILVEGGGHYGFEGVSKTPLLNLFSLLKTGMFTLGDVALNPGTHKMQAFVEYEEKETFERFDDISYAKFAADAKLPDALKLIFNSFSRAFFAPAEKMSMAELIKSFHFYFLGHNKGLGYDFPTEHYESSVLAPMREHLESHDVEIRLETPVQRIEAGGQNLRVNGEEFDYMVMAADVVGTRHILEASPAVLQADPRLAGQISKLEASNEYAVLRVWADRDEGAHLPAFVITDKPVVLDSISFYHRIEDHARAWADEHGGGVYELHCYAIPDDFEGGDAELEAALLEDLYGFVPELRGMQVKHKHLQRRRNFTALHVGAHEARPETQTADPRIVLAGDWVKLPIPVMLMEGACTSGIYAANAILEHESLQQAAVASIPLRGLLRQG